MQTRTRDVLYHETWWTHKLRGEVNELAPEQGVRPGALVSGILRAQIELLSEPISSAELERRIRYRQ